MAEPLSGRSDASRSQGRGERVTRDEAPPRGSVRGSVERAVREALLTGRFVPGRAVTLRGLAQELGVSPMPVREAVRALSAGNALEIRPNGRIQVPTMTRPRLEEILKARLLLEPELAGLAGSGLSRADAADLEAIDDRIDESLDGGDAETYMRLNHAFHFRIYTAAGSQVFLPLVETLWLQFAPFMRTVYGRVGTSALVDHHKEAIDAIRCRDVRALQDAIAADIRCGMDLLVEGFPAPG